MSAPAITALRVRFDQASADAVLAELAALRLLAERTADAGHRVPDRLLSLLGGPDTLVKLRFVEAEGLPASGAVDVIARLEPTDALARLGAAVRAWHRDLDLSDGA